MRPPPHIADELSHTVDHLYSVFLLVRDGNVLGTHPEIDLFHGASKSAQHKHEHKHKCWEQGFLEISQKSLDGECSPLMSHGGAVYLVLTNQFDSMFITNLFHKT